MISGLDAHPVDRWDVEALKMHCYFDILQGNRLYHDRHRLSRTMTSPTTNVPIRQPHQTLLRSQLLVST